MKNSEESNNQFEKNTPEKFKFIRKYRYGLLIVLVLITLVVSVQLMIHGKALSVSANRSVQNVRSQSGGGQEAELPVTPSTIEVRKDFNRGVFSLAGISAEEFDAIGRENIHLSGYFEDMSVETIGSDSDNLIVIIADPLNNNLNTEPTDDEDEIEVAAWEYTFGGITVTPNNGNKSYYYNVIVKIAMTASPPALPSALPPALPSALPTATPTAKPTATPTASPDDPKRWMSALPDYVRLTDVTIPGTHDSAAGGYGSMTVSAKCQDKNITKQLEEGIRYFDLRLGENNNKLVLFHGIVDCNVSLDTIMKEFKTFLAGSNETIVVQVSNEKDVKNISDKFAQQALNHSDYKGLWYKGQTFPTLGEARGKLVLLRNFEAPFKDLPERGIPFYDVKNRPINKNVESYNGTTETTDGKPVSFYVQDRYSISSVSGRMDRVARSNKKVELINSLLSTAAANAKSNKYFFINFWSHAFAAGGDLSTFPSDYASAINGAMWNTHMGQFRNKHNPGAQVMDFYRTTIVETIIKSNFTSYAEAAFRSSPAVIKMPPVKDGWYHVNVKSSAGTSFFLSTENGKAADGTQLALRNNGKEFQDSRFYFEIDYNNEYRIKTSLVEKFVEVRNSSTTAGESISIWKWSDAANRKWIAEPFENGFRFKNKNSRLYMEPNAISAGAKVSQQKSGTTCFVLSPILDYDLSAGMAAVETGWYQIRTPGGFYVSLKDGKTGNGTDLVLSDKTDNNSKFYIEAVAQGEFKIKSRDSAKVVEVDNSSYDDGAQAQIWDWKSPYENRTWILAEVGDGAFYFLNKNSGSVLGLKQGSGDKNNTPVVQRVNTNNGVKFTLISTSKP